MFRACGDILELELARDAMVARPTVPIATLEVNNLVIVGERGSFQVARVRVASIAVNDLEVRGCSGLTRTEYSARLGAVRLQDTGLFPNTICSRRANSNLEKVT